MNFKKERRPKMKISKKKRKNKLNTFVDVSGYDYYLGLDYSQDGYSLARLGAKSKTPKYSSGLGKVDDIREELKKIRGKKILTIEETTSTHWLYVELREEVDRIVVCDPYRNSLLKDGAKNDEIDAGNLSLLLRGGFIREVYHTMEDSYQIRKLLSGYEDLIKLGVRLKNQRSALYRAEGLNVKKDKGLPNKELLLFVDSIQKEMIAHYEENRERYLEKFKQLRKKIPVIDKMCKISGIDTISAVKIYGTVLDAKRFANKNKYWGYCGLAKHQKTSGKRNYGQRQTRYSRLLKSVYKTAALAAIGGNNDISEYYEELITNGLSQHKARNAISRYIATSTYAMMKTGSPYKPYSWRKKERKKRKTIAKKK